MNYKEILLNVAAKGIRKNPQRGDKKLGVSTISSFCEIFRHDMSEGFPLTSLRPIPWKSLRVELEGFIKGITQKTWYQERGCKYWDYWASPVLVKEKMDKWLQDNPGASEEEKESITKQFQKEISWLGPIYGFQWRYFGDNTTDEADQLKTIVKTLKTNPYDRRMVCSAWNPLHLKNMALPPCHWGFNVVVLGERLNLVWHQRSIDVALGLPSNIASYALLLLLLAKTAGLQPGELVGTLADCHIYENHFDNVTTMLAREERPLPTVEIKYKYGGDFEIWNWEYYDVELIGYDPHPAINMGSVFV